MRKRIAPIDRLLARIQIDENGCWIFAGAKTGAGYGLIGLGGKAEGVAYTHRLSYEHHVGPIPDRYQVDHLCRVRSCCNPSHLEAVPQAVNNRRALALRPRLTHCKHGHEFTPENTGRSTNGFRYCRGCLHRRNADAYQNRRRSTAA